MEKYHSGDVSRCEIASHWVLIFISQMPNDLLLSWLHIVDDLGGHIFSITNLINFLLIWFSDFFFVINF